MCTDTEGALIIEELYRPPGVVFPRIHLMAGRVPPGADGAAMRGEMEAVFLENLKHAAGVLAQVRQQKRYAHISCAVEVHECKTDSSANFGICPSQRDS